MPSVPDIPQGRTARRLTWEFLPPELRREIEARLGGRVVTATSHNSGFTPGFASSLYAENGATLFVKTAHKSAQAVAARSYLAEARSHLGVAGSSGHNTEFPSPKLLWTIDGGWITLGFENIEAIPPQRPWTNEQFRSALDVAEAIAHLAPPSGLVPLADDVPDLLTAWQHVRVREPQHPHLAQAFELAQHFATLPSTALAHSELRDDNLLFCANGSVLACDWSNPALGPAWLDTLTLAISAYGDGLDVDAHLSGRRVMAGATDHEVDAWLAAFAGYMRYSSMLRPVRNSPFLRLHADWQATVAWQWLAERRGWNEF